MALSLGAIYWFSAVQMFTGEHTKAIIQQITGMNEESAYAMNALVRKSVHVLAFGFLATFFYKVLKYRPARYAWLFSTLIAILDEWHQSFVPGRTPLLMDVLLDSTAAFFFLTGIALMRRLKKRN